MSNIHTENISYTANGDTMRGFLAYDTDTEGERPGVLVIHEWWGLNDYIRKRAQQIAGLGYRALALDMYGEGRTGDAPDQAGELMNAVLGDMNVGTARLKAAYQTLHDHPTVDGDRLAAIGYCFGGAMALHMARIGMPLRAVVSFHGALGSFHKPAKDSVKAKILVCHGADDAMIPHEDVRKFKAEMDTAGADYTFIAYDGAKHGFTSQAADENGKKYGIPLAYNATADNASWKAMRELLEEVF